MDADVPRWHCRDKAILEARPPRRKQAPPKNANPFRIAIDKGAPMSIANVSRTGSRQSNGLTGRTPVAPVFVQPRLI